ncbi:hypothetical protein [Priestia megaterium]|uniref:hypothetical protein n=1 Tax=Priestia megaterium TaxID=1404 RepID=UPI002EAB46FA|nr:hypothetical protein [Priestia megaterium]
MNGYEFELVNAYLESIKYTDVYTEKSMEDREKLVFTAYDKLTNFYDEKYLTPKVIGLQTVYMIEGEEEEHAMFKRQGVKSMNVEGISFSYDLTQQISPDVVEIITREQEKEIKPSGARTARLI